MRSVRVAMFVAAVCLQIPSAYSQVLYGTVVGNVTDPSESSVAGPTVQLSNKDTGYSVETKSDDRGFYEFRNLNPGQYDVKITASGFATFEAGQIPVTANTIARVDGQLKVGQLSEVVTVGAEVVQLQTDKSDLHTDISSRELDADPRRGISELSVHDRLRPGRDAGSVPERIDRLAGASPDHQRQRHRAEFEQHPHRRRGERVHMAAAPLLLRSPLESIETVNISTNNFDAEQGMSGGAAVTVITKSGTNSFHGVGVRVSLQSLVGREEPVLQSEHARGSRDSAAHRQPVRRHVRRTDQKDKLFFFTSWEGTTTAERGNGC